MSNKTVCSKNPAPNPETATDMDAIVYFLGALEENVQEQGIDSAIAKIEYLQRAEAHEFGSRVLNETMKLLIRLKEEGAGEITLTDANILIHSVMA